MISESQAWFCLSQLDISLGPSDTSISSSITSEGNDNSNLTELWWGLKALCLARRKHLQWYLSSQLSGATNFSNYEKQMFVRMYVCTYVCIYTDINFNLEIVNVNATLSPSDLKVVLMELVCVRLTSPVSLTTLGAGLRVVPSVSHLIAPSCSVPKCRHSIGTQEMPQSVLFTTRVQKPGGLWEWFWFPQVTCTLTWDTHTTGCGSRQPRFLGCSLPLANQRSSLENRNPKRRKRNSQNL